MWMKKNILIVAAVALGIAFFEVWSRAEPLHVHKGGAGRWGGGGKRDRRPAALQAGGGGYSDGVGRGRGSDGGRWGGRLLSAAGWKSLLFPLQSLFERQGMAAHAGVLAGAEKPHVSLRKGIPRTKSVGKARGDRGGVPHPQGVQPSP